jgi:hypothetical protein
VIRTLEREWEKCLYVCSKSTARDQTFRLEGASVRFNKEGELQSITLIMTL